MPAQIVTLLGAKGGEGTTFAAVNLAVDLRRLTNRKVLLIDFSLPFGGDVNFLLGLETSRTMVDLAAVQTDLCRRNELVGYEMPERFYEIGSHGGLKELDQLLRTGSAPR